MAAGAVVTGVSVGVVVDWEDTGCPSGLTGVSESPLEAGAVFGAAALACMTIMPTLQGPAQVLHQRKPQADVSDTEHTEVCTPAGCIRRSIGTKELTLAALGAGALAAAEVVAGATGAAGWPLLLTGVSESPELDTGVSDRLEPDAGAAGVSGAAGESVESEEEALWTGQLLSGI